MHSKTFALIALGAVVSAIPMHFPQPRAVDKLNEEATAEAHPRDNTATRAFSSVAITTNGKCLFVDPLSGDFRANLLPIQVKDCDGSDGEKWDIITAGKHNDQPGTMLIVSSLTQGCFNFDPRRQPGDQVNIFSCGGRADGGGAVTNSQLFNFTEVTAGPLSLQPGNQAGTCLTSGGARLDQAPCKGGDDTQIFTFSQAGAGGGNTDDTPAPSGGAGDDVAAPSATLTESGFSTIVAPTATSTAGAVGGGSNDEVVTTVSGFKTIEPPATTAAPVATGGTGGGNQEPVTVTVTVTAGGNGNGNGNGRARGKGKGKGKKVAAAEAKSGKGHNHQH